MRETSLVKVIEEIIKENTFLQQYGEDTCRITESNSEKHSLRKVDLSGLPKGESIGFKLDYFKSKSNYFKNSIKLLHKGVDGVIFSKIDGRYFVFICELKSKQYSTNDVKQKFLSSKLFVNYLIEISRELYGFNEGVTFKFILLHLTKKKPRIRQTQPYEVKYATNKYDGFDEEVYEVSKGSPKNFKFDITNAISSR